MGKFHDSGLEYDVRLRLKPEQREKLATSMEKPAGPRVGYPVDDESGFGNFFDDPVRGVRVAAAWVLGAGLADSSKAGAELRHSLALSIADP